ncbi:MAG: hypothetical protein JXL81_00905, partial [Deltaproteobacteria bacterium]|nr:hypothetical protein [Deltaproteobacteria bacterium]
MKKKSQITISLKYAFFALILMILFLTVSPAVMAESENDLLKQRIEKLEKELNELKTLIGKKSAEEETVAKPAATATKPSEGFSIKPYGYIKLDAAYTDSTVTNGNYLVFVPSEGAEKNDDKVNVTARQTRLGLAVTAPEYEGWKTTGKVEIDFYGDGSTAHENKTEPMMRHAFIETGKGDWSFLAGQTWDVISPLNPNTLNYTVGWGAGNIGYRRPQIRASYNISLFDDTDLTTQFAVSRTAGLTNEDLDGMGQNDGDDSGFPTVQARVAYSTKLFTEKKATLGISGHYGEEEADYPGGGRDHESWSMNIDLFIPLPERFTLSGEFFVGENLDDYFGGAIQGVNIISRDEISAIGMWTQLSYSLNKDMQYNAGFGFDNPDNDDLNIGNRARNSFYYVNTMYKVMPALTLG